jgi:acetyl-CoA carboxylase biotin carboxyl carrier protein
MNLKDIKELIHTMEESSLTQLEVKNKDFRLSLSKGACSTTVARESVQVQPVSVVANDTAQKTNINQNDLVTTNSSSAITINSPMVGTFYSAPSPEASPFVKVGDTIRKGQPLCILEAMKIMNEIDAEYDCKIVKVLVEDSQAVEFDMPIFEVEKI